MDACGCNSGMLSDLLKCTPDGLADHLRSSWQQPDLQVQQVHAPAQERGTTSFILSSPSAWPSQVVRLLQCVWTCTWRPLQFTGSGKTDELMLMASRIPCYVRLRQACSVQHQQWTSSRRQAAGTPLYTLLVKAIEADRTTCKQRPCTLQDSDMTASWQPDGRTCFEDFKRLQAEYGEERQA